MLRGSTSFSPRTFPAALLHAWMALARAITWIGGGGLITNDACTRAGRFTAKGWPLDRHDDSNGTSVKGSNSTARHSTLMAFQDVHNELSISLCSRRRFNALVFFVSSRIQVSRFSVIIMQVLLFDQSMMVAESPEPRLSPGSSPIK